MFKKFFFVFLLSVSILFVGCAPKRYQKPVPALIVFKTPKLRYADQGFLYRGEGHTKLQIYISGRAAFTLSAGRNVCVNDRCMDEKRFDETFLGVLYPEGTVGAILAGRPIFGKKGLHCRQGVCEQRIAVPGRYDIIYAFGSGHVRFKDRKNHILIKITEIE